MLQVTKLIYALTLVSHVAFAKNRHIDLEFNRAGPFSDYAPHAVYEPLNIAGDDGFIPQYQKYCDENYVKLGKVLGKNASYDYTIHDETSFGISAFSGTLQIFGQTIQIKSGPWEYHWPALFTAQGQLAQSYEYAGSQLVIKDIPEVLKQLGVESIKVLHLKPMTFPPCIENTIAVSLIFPGPIEAMIPSKCYLYSSHYW